MNSGGHDGEIFLRLALIVDEALIPGFNTFLQQGVTVRVRSGSSVDSFLRTEIGAGAEMIGKIQSVILDGMPVDDLSSARLRDGSVLALSAAMPGLVGATLRRGGAYSSLRGSITYHEPAGSSISGEGYVKLKVFNLLMAGIGRDLLRKGVIVGASVVRDFFAEQSPGFWHGCRQITVDGKCLANGEKNVAEWLSGREKVFLSVSAG